MAKYRVWMSVTYETSLDIEAEDEHTAWDNAEKFGKHDLPMLVEKAKVPRIEAYEIEEIEDTNWDEEDDDNV